ncbi:MAG TPA: hypothetical protein DEA96_14110, partial [Leptospiraceae bacterium]|nr:hypothetical protein [Leptospiraceae bacterium]
PATDVEHTPELGARIRTDFMDGIAKVNDEFIILLKADMVLNLDELAQVHETLKLKGKEVVEELAPLDDTLPESAEAMAQSEVTSTSESGQP